MKRILLSAGLVLSLGLVVLVASTQRPAGATLEVYKSPTCGCCSLWVEHVKQAGFTAQVTDISDAELDRLKTKHGVPRTAQSCHTALVNGYVVEGHVPAKEIQRLLKEKPAVAGIAVGGMPIGSPGMEVPGGLVQPYNVVSFDKAGNVRVFASIK